MNEKKLITAKFKKNKFSYCAILIGLVLVIIGLILAIKTYDAGRCSDEGFLGHLFTDMFCFSVLCSGEILSSVITYAGLIPLIIGSVFSYLMNKCEMVVTEHSVTGKASFGRSVDLPLKQISAVGLGMFNKISVATSSGTINFWLVDNRDEVRSVLLSQINKPDQEKNNTPKSSSSESIPDELNKYKQLLDNGVITQEEFDAKKRELLQL